MSYIILVVKMGAILGTVAGWQRDTDWTLLNRLYIGPAYLKFDVPKEKISSEGSVSYKVTVDITVYLCESGDLETPIVTRKIEGIKLIAVYEYDLVPDLDLDIWVESVTIKEAEELVARSSVETAGLVSCEKGYKIHTYDDEKIIPTEPEIPEFILRTIKDLEIRRDVAKTKGRREAIQKTIDRLKMEYEIE